MRASRGQLPDQETRNVLNFQATENNPASSSTYASYPGLIHSIGNRFCGYPWAGSASLIRSSGIFPGASGTDLVRRLMSLRRAMMKEAKR
jgi:hypothetical protein